MAFFSFLLDFRLRLTKDVLDDGFSGFGISANRVPALPTTILAFSDVPFPICSSFRHNISLLCNGKPYRKQQRKATGKWNSYQKVIICLAVTSALSLPIAAQFLRCRGRVFSYSGAIFERMKSPFY
ncbi:MAG: hypothetical protein ACLSHO_02850 [Dysosmobacter sp.]